MDEDCRSLVVDCCRRPALAALQTVQAVESKSRWRWLGNEDGDIHSRQSSGVVIAA